MDICGILSLVVGLVGIFVAVSVCGIGAVVLGVIGLVGSKKVGVRIVATLGIVLGVVEVILFSLFLNSAVTQ